MEQKNKLIEEREQLQQEYNKWLKIQIEAFQKQDNLLPEFGDAPDGMMIKLDDSTESFSEYDLARQEEREAARKVKETLAKIAKINARLQSA